MTNSGFETYSDSCFLGSGVLYAADLLTGSHSGDHFFCLLPRLFPVALRSLVQSRNGGFSSQGTCGASESVERLI